MSQSLVAMPELRSLGQAFMMIVFSEIGDRTWLLAAILAMRHDRMTVFMGAFVSLLIMSVLSAALGNLVPILIPKRWTEIAAAVLFFVFGALMAREGWKMKGGSEDIQEELEEAEEELEKDEEESPEDDGASLLERGPRTPRTPPRTPATPLLEHSQMVVPRVTIKQRVRNIAKVVLGPVFVQSFLLTFLGEWGDRSQFATLALGAAHNMWLVALGTIIGHTACTGLAVLCGSWLSTRLSLKHITLAGALLFLIFGVLYATDAWYAWSVVLPDLSSVAELGSGDVGEALANITGRR